MKRNKLVSIITPSFNSARFIEECILSVISQTYINWEMLIVDDCSQDNSVNIISKFSNSEMMQFLNFAFIEQWHRTYID